jgi:endonuclease G
MKSFQNICLILPFIIFCNACSVEAATVKMPAKIERVDYEGFTLWLDCNQRGAVKFQYNAQRDTGSFPRLEKFFVDKNIPKDCQQTSAKSYGRNYDRGHLVPANHLDYSKQAISDSNSMANILPQAATMNRGAWLLTEEIIECYRDIDELLVIGGVIWGNNSKDDYFVKSHGIKTPDAYWKVVIRGDINNEKVIAWIVPNSSSAQRSKLDSYLVSVAEIERQTGEKIPSNSEFKNDVLKTSWLLPKGCNKG